MAVTGLGCNRPLWRFHRGPDPLPSLLCAHTQPRSAPGIPFSGDLARSLTNRTQPREKRVAAPKVCVSVTPECVFPAGYHVHHTTVKRNQEGVALDGDRLQGTIAAAPTRWVVVSVEARSEWNRQRTPPSGPACTSLVEERSARDGRFHARDHGGGLWLRPECTGPSSGRHGRRQLGRSGGGGRTRQDRQVRLGLFRPAGRILCPVPVTYGLRR